ncbi:Unknown protein, partial [Striga hermonthica]
VTAIINFVDHKTKFTWIYFLKHKSDASNAFIHFRTLVENRFSKKIKIVQSDGGTEYKPLSDFFHQNGITHRMSCPYTPEQNGSVERKHRHIVDSALSILAQSSVLKRYWDHAFSTAVYLLNRVPSKVLNFLSPFEALTGTKPDYKHTR